MDPVDPLSALTEDILAEDRREQERRSGQRRRGGVEDLTCTLAIAEHNRNQALRKAADLQAKLNMIESHMTMRFAYLALAERTPGNQARIDELKQLLRRIQGRN